MMNFKQAYNYLAKKNYKYKGRSITYRTIRTMVDNGYFNTDQCVCGNKLIPVSELDSKIKKQHEE